MPRHPFWTTWSGRFVDKKKKKITKPLKFNYLHWHQKQAKVPQPSQKTLNWWSYRPNLHFFPMKWRPSWILQFTGLGTLEFTFFFHSVVQKRYKYTSCHSCHRAKWWACSENVTLIVNVNLWYYIRPKTIDCCNGITGWTQIGQVGRDLFINFFFFFFYYSSIYSFLKNFCIYNVEKSNTGKYI